MDSGALVSIITPLFNACPFFEETFQSVLNQTTQNYEWIIIDDCSTDGSFELAKALTAGHSNIILIKMTQNGGSAKARNKGLDIAKGHYVTFLDADDLLDPNYLENQLAFIQRHGPLITASYRRSTPKGLSVFQVPKETTFKTILAGNPMSCLTTMYDRSAFPNERFPEDMSRHEDFVFWANLLKRGFIAYGNPDVLATYRLHESSKNSRKWKLVGPLIRAYHDKLGFCWIKSIWMTLRYAIYSKQKYKGA